jgi:hypothetical protein
MDKSSPAVLGPVQSSVRPRAWIAPTALAALAKGSPRARVTTELRNTPETYDVPLYDGAAVDALMDAAAADRLGHVNGLLLQLRQMAAECADRGDVFAQRVVRLLDVA